MGGGGKRGGGGDCYPLWKKVLIEALATFVVLVVHFLAAACVVEAEGSDEISGKLTIALIQGLSVFLIVALFWRSGPHANVLVSLLAFISRSLPRLDVISLVAFWAVQVGFSVLAGLTARAILGSGSLLGLPSITTTNPIAFLVESFLSFLSSLSILTVSVNYQKVEGLRYNNPALVLGFTHAVLVFIGLGSGTGGVVNSLRHFGVAVFVTGGFTGNDWWIYYLSHLLGAVVALLFFLVVLKERSGRKKR